MVVVVVAMESLLLVVIDAGSIIDEKHLSNKFSHEITMPRKYDMSKRTAAVEATRRRIVDATVELHHEQGILGTSWEDIAKRADVALATVYRHFPSLDELVPACGALTMEQLELPTDERIEQAFASARSTRQRIRRLVEELFALYERGDDTLREISQNRHRFAPVQLGHEAVEERLAALTAAALASLEPSDSEVAVVRALTDHATWRALRERGIEGEQAVETTSSLIEAWLKRR
jgi:AcrR family transcriptional regulator